MKSNSITITLVIAVIVGAVGFYGGMQFQKSQRGSFPGGMNGMPNGLPIGGSGARGNTSKTGIGSRPFSGEITKVDQNTITVKTQDGSSKIVIFSTSTKVNKTTEGASTDLVTGGQVTVIGTEGTNGTITAQNIAVGSSALPNMPAGNPPTENGQQPPTNN
jgi:hypothetical protein